MNTTKTKKLSFYNDQGILTLTAKQFDTGRRFVFHIMDNDMPFDLSGCTAYLRIAKADGTQFQGHECCTVECSKIIINTAVGNGSQILTAAGINACELHLKDANDIALTTWTFHIVVEPRVHDGSHMSSIDSYDVLDNMINMEKERIASEKQRKENEENRKTVFEQKIGETNSVITECRLVIDTANQKINSFDEEINEIVDGITDEAQSYANNAKASETNAANAASSAAYSANTASQKASDAAASAALSQSYAVGGTGIREGEDSDNAKEYARQAKASTDDLQERCISKTEKGTAGGVATLDGNGKIPEAQLPDDIGSVTGVKGDKESAYRTGDVNLTAENVGALSLKGGTVNGKVTVNNSFIVNKASTTDPTEITELDIHSNSKVAINTTGTGTKSDSLIHFEGGPGGTITSRAQVIDSYVQSVRQHNYDLTVSGSNTITFRQKKFRAADNYSNGIQIGGGDVYIGDVSSVSDGLSYDSGKELLHIQSYSTDNAPQTRIFTNNFKIGREDDYFLDYQYYGNYPSFKLRYGNNGSNIQCTKGTFQMWTNDNGLELLNNSSALQPIGEVALNKNDGTSRFNTDVILRCDDETHNADLYLETGNIFGERGTNRYNHAIRLGHAGNDHCDFYEYGGVYNFYSSESGSKTLLGRITSNGWEGNASTATRAGADANGNNIADTYAKKSVYDDTVINCGRKENTIIGAYSTAEGKNTTASRTAAHAEGNDTIASGNYSHAEGGSCKATGGSAHAEGYLSTASGENSHAEGLGTTASGSFSHAEGRDTIAKGNRSHAEGTSCEASGTAAHAEGWETIASGEQSHAEGLRTTASGNFSHASGEQNIASNYSSCVFGKYSKNMTTGGGKNNQVGDVLVVGNGTESTRSNALRVTYLGDVMGTKAFQSSGADYAEFIKPWADGNPNSEDRVGYFVTVKDGLLQKANDGDYITGITSGNPSVIGNADEDYYWRYERDEFNRIVMEDAPETVQATDDNGNPLFDEETEPIMIETGNIVPNARMKLAENYDPSLQENYIERKKRKEWDYVGMVGVLPVRDDGTCLPDHYCKCGQEGIATLTEERGFDTFYVIERLSDTVVSVELR